MGSFEAMLNKLGSQQAQFSRGNCSKLSSCSAGYGAPRAGGTLFSRPWGLVWLINDNCTMRGADGDLQLSKLGDGPKKMQRDRTQQGVRRYRKGDGEQQDRP